MTWFTKVGPSAEPITKKFIDWITDAVVDDLSHLFDEVPEDDQLKKRLEGAVKDYANQISEDDQRQYLVDVGEIDELDEDEDEEEEEECDELDDFDCETPDCAGDCGDAHTEDGVRFRRV